MNSRAILARLEHLENRSLTDDGVVILEQLEDGTWELSFGRSKSTHRTMEEGQEAYKERLRKRRKSEENSVLIIADI